MLTKKRKQTQRAFTLVEILLVVVIIGVLAAMIIPNLDGNARRYRR